MHASRSAGERGAILSGVAPRFVPLLSLLLAACGLDQLEVPVEAEVTIAGQPFGSTVPLSSLGPLGPLAKIDFASTDEFKSGGYDADSIESVKLTKLSLTVLEPTAPDGSLDFLDSIAFLSDGQTLASLDPVPDGISATELEVEDVELKDAATSGGIALTTEATGLPPRYDTRLKVKATFTVDVAVF